MCCYFYRNHRHCLQQRQQLEQQLNQQQQRLADTAQFSDLDTGLPAHIQQLQQFIHQYQTFAQTFSSIAQAKQQLSEQQKQAVLAKEYKAQVKQLIEMNRITVARGDIGFNFTDNNLIKKIMVDKPTQTQLINGRLAIARLAVDNKPEGEYAIIPAVVAEKIAQRDASSIVLHSALSQDEQDEDDPYADFKVPDDLMW